MPFSLLVTVTQILMYDLWFMMFVYVVFGGCDEGAVGIDGCLKFPLFKMTFDEDRWFFILDQDMSLSRYVHM